MASNDNTSSTRFLSSGDASMKLTNDQIETERKRFIEKVKIIDRMKLFPANTNMLDGEFEDFGVETAFYWWLACRESNNEVIIPVPYLDGICESIEKDELVKMLESQGYTIKQGEQE